MIMEERLRRHIQSLHWNEGGEFMTIETIPSLGHALVELVDGHSENSITYSR